MTDRVVIRNLGFIWVLTFVNRELKEGDAWKKFCVRE